MAEFFLYLGGLSAPVTLTCVLEIVPLLVRRQLADGRILEEVGPAQKQRMTKSFTVEAEAKEEGLPLMWIALVAALLLLFCFGLLACRRRRKNESSSDEDEKCTVSTPPLASVGGSVCGSDCGDIVPTKFPGLMKGPKAGGDMGEDPSEVCMSI